MTTDQPTDPAHMHDELVERMLRKKEEEETRRVWLAAYKQSYERQRREEDRWRYPLAVALGFVAGVILTLIVVWLTRLGGAS